MTRRLDNIVETAMRYATRAMLNEAGDDSTPPFFDYINDYDEHYILSEFQNDPKHNTIWFPLIEPTEYQKALDELMQFGQIVRFPAKKIYQWMGICMKNIALLDASTCINGHSQGTDIYDFVDIFFNGEMETFRQWCEEHGEDPDWSGEWAYLYSIGFEDWEDSVLDEIGTNLSDYGIRPLSDLACQYREDMTPGEVLVLINKILDVTHHTSDLSRLFIRGGAGLLNRVSDPIRFGPLAEAVVRELTAYHGTGPDKDFDRFDLAFARQGTGHMAYGHGVYVAREKDTAKEYATLYGRNPGNLQVLTVEIPDDDGGRSYIDWDKPLGGRRDSGLRCFTEAELAATSVIDDAVNLMLDNDEDGMYDGVDSKQILRDHGLSNVGEISGGDFYNSIALLLGGEDEASRFLASHGYYGIRVYDRKNDFYNYVIFDPGNVKIVGREKLTER